MKETEQPWLQWLKGRQNSGYEKMILFINKIFIPFDLHILKYLKDPLFLNIQITNRGIGITG